MIIYLRTLSSALRLKCQSPLAMREKEETREPGVHLAGASGTSSCPTGPPHDVRPCPALGGGWMRRTLLDLEPGAVVFSDFLFG